MSTRGSALWMRETWGPACHPTLIVVPIYAGGPRVQVEARIRDAVIAAGRVFLRWGYVVRRIGGYNCRPNTSDSSVPSNHSWGTAIDVNDDTNPYNRAHLITDMPRGMVADICAIKTTGGMQVWRAGYDWDSNPNTVSPPYDPMHFEIFCTPSELAMGIPADLPHGKPAGEPAVHSYPTIREGARGTAVMFLQSCLACAPEDGVFGPATTAAVKAYQAQRGLVPDGVVGAATWTVLLANLPFVVRKG